jgi:hypothetical protein
MLQFILYILIHFFIFIYLLITLTLSFPFVNMYKTDPKLVNLRFLMPKISNQTNLYKTYISYSYPYSVMCNGFHDGRNKSLHYHSQIQNKNTNTKFRFRLES